MANLPADGARVYLFEVIEGVTQFPYLEMKQCDSNGDCSFVVPDGTYQISIEDYPTACDEEPFDCTHYGVIPPDISVSGGQIVNISEVLERKV